MTLEQKIEIHKRVFAEDPELLAEMIAFEEEQEIRRQRHERLCELATDELEKKTRSIQSYLASERTDEERERAKEDLTVILVELAKRRRL